MGPVPGHGQPIAGPRPSSDDVGFLTTLGELREASYSDKATIVDRLVQSGHPRVRAALTALLDDRLAFRNTDNQILILKSADGDPFVLIDPLSLQDAGSAPADSVTKIGTNNALRKTVRTALAHFSLSNPDSAARLEAVREMGQSLDDATLALLRERNGVETDAKVKREIATVLALGALEDHDPGARLKAIATLRGSLSQDVRNHLAGVLEDENSQVRSAARQAVASIDRWRTFYSAVQTLFFGLSLGSVLVLIAIGLAITFGVVGVINMAHGELMMLGAYTTYAVQTAMPGHIGVSILAAIPAAFFVSGRSAFSWNAASSDFYTGGPWRPSWRPSESA